jgi:hypothetical protein
MNMLVESMKKKSKSTVLTGGLTGLLLPLVQVYGSWGRDYPVYYLYVELMD